MKKVITVTWSYDEVFDLKDTFLYKSFIKNNDESNLIHIHYNRNNFLKLEEEYKQKYAYQYEFLLYKISLLKDKIKNINADYLIFCDANDTVCLGNINDIPLPESVIFSTEINQYPSSMGDWGGLEYSESERSNRNFLNAGLFIASKSNYIELLESVTKNILSLNIKTFGGDQGVFIFHYLSKGYPEITIDKESKIFFCSFSRDHNNYLTYKFPIFLHDNGWNWGSPRFIEKFNLV
jgi:hypothetical protein